MIALSFHERACHMEIVERLVHGLIFMIFWNFFGLLSFANGFFEVLFFFNGISLQRQIIGGNFGTPIVYIIVLDFVGFASLYQQVLKIFIIGLLFKFQSFGIINEDCELSWESLAQKLGWSRDLLVHYHFVLCFGVFRFHVLPGKDASQQVHQNIPDWLDIVAPRLLNPHVRVYRCIASRPC